MIEVVNINKELKGITVLSGISYNFENGKTYLITGPNGCGKTMFLRTLCGLITPTRGKIITNEKLSYGVIIEVPTFMNNETALYNLKYLASIQKKIGIKEINAVMNKLNLFKDRNRKVKEFSLGMKQRLGICQAIMEDPDVLLLDEPFNAIDEENLICIYEILNKMRVAGKTIIIASHGHIDNDKLIVDKQLKMESGKLIL